MQAPILSSFAAGLLVFSLGADTLHAEQTGDPAGALSSGGTRFFDRTLERTVEEPWRFRAQLNGWGPDIPLKLTRGNESRQGTITLDDLLDNLNWVVEPELQVRKGPFGAFIDAVVMDLDFEGEELDGKIELDAADTIYYLNYGLSYEMGRIAFSDDPHGAGVLLEGYAGVRSLNDSVTLNTEAFGNNLGGDSVELTFVTPIVGLRTYWDLTENWKLFGSADIGGFDAFKQDVHRTYAGVASIGYQFGLFDIPTTFNVGYRAVYIDFRKNNEKLEVWAYGPQLSLTFDF